MRFIFLLRGIKQRDCRPYGALRKIPVPNALTLIVRPSFPASRVYCMQSHLRQLLRLGLDPSILTSTF